MRNPAFRGLTPEIGFDLASYHHFRNVQDPEKAKNLLEDDAVFSSTFLDDIINDEPLGVWSIQKDSNGSTAVIRNHFWPGYTAYHRVGSKFFGGVYVGEGIKNVDLAFYF